MSIEEIVLEAEERMEKSVALLTDQLRGVRTGRANVGLVDSIRVEYYGSQTPLKQLANLSTPEPQQILIRPFDPSVVGDIVKAIQSSDIGLMPNSDGKVVRLNVPALSDRTAQEAGRPRQGPRRGSPGLDPQHPPRRQQAGRPRTGREAHDRGRPRPVARKRSRPSPSGSRARSTSWPKRSRPRCSNFDQPPGKVIRDSEIPDLDCFHSENYTADVFDRWRSRSGGCTSFRI